MAVELTKVALWIETVDPGLPLGFFDAQIRCGDALLGVFDLKVLEDDIPDAAETPLDQDGYSELPLAARCTEVCYADFSDLWRFRINDRFNGISACTVRLLVRVFSCAKSA